MAESVDLPRIEEARVALRGIVHETPALGSHYLEKLVGRPVFLKAENLQRTGSFKIRGAYNALRRLDPAQRERGVVTASAGNHAQGVALAACLLGIPCTVSMPANASITKIQATQGYGAEVILEGQSFDEAVAAGRSRAEGRRAIFLSAYDHDDVIAGQGTVGLELVEQVPDVEQIVVPVGGGGLLSGIALAAKALRPGVRVVGVQAESASAAVEAWRTGVLRPAESHPRTIADGIAIKSPSERTLGYLRQYVDEMVTVADEEIADAVLLLLQRTKLLVEPAGAAATAALLSGRISGAGKTVALLSGGNIDTKLLSDLIERGMLRAGRYLHCFTSVQDRPGHLALLLGEIAGAGANVMSVTHDRISKEVPLGQTGVELLRDAAHGGEVLARLRQAGYRVREIGEPAG